MNKPSCSGTSRTDKTHGGAKDKSPGFTFSADFTPGPYDVICGRGNGVWNHKGNQFLRTLIQHGKQRYGSAQTKRQRSDVVSDIVAVVRSKGHGFVKRNNSNRWYEVGDYLSREKVGQVCKAWSGLPPSLILALEGKETH